MNDEGLGDGEMGRLGDLETRRRGDGENFGFRIVNCELGIED